MTASLQKSAIRTDSERARDTALIRPTVAFDGGNRTIQWVDPTGGVHTIPSFIKSIDPTWEDVSSDEKSVVIEFEGQTFVIGQAAKDLNGVPVFQDDKVKLAQRMVLAALQPNPGQNVLRVERLLIALPNSRNEADVAALRAIAGTFDFKRNGKPIIATVRTVEAVDETRAAYVFAMRSGLFLSRKNLNGILDLGGGTSILRLYSTSGALMREADLILPGTYDLARRIAARITRDLATSPNLSLIMDAIEAGDYLLGTTGYCFHSAFEIARDEWLAEIRGAIKTRWGQWLPSLGEVLIIGGSAPLAAPIQEATKGRFKIAQNPQSISIVGMATL